MKLSSKLFLMLLLLTVACSVDETPERTKTVSRTVQPTVTIHTIPSTTPTVSMLANLQNTPSPVALATSTTPAIGQPCLKPREVQILPENLKKGALLLYNRQNRTIFSKDLPIEKQSDLNDARKNGVFVAPDKKSIAYLVQTEGNNNQLAYSQLDGPTIKTFPIEKSLFGEWPLFAGWLNNNMVAFQIFGHQPTTLLAVDLVSGKKKDTCSRLSRYQPA